MKLRVSGFVAAVFAVVVVDSAGSGTNSNIRRGAQEGGDVTRELLDLAAGVRSSIREVDDFKPRQTTTCGECSDAMLGVRATDSRDNIFNQLSVREYESIVNFVIDRGLADMTMDGVDDWEKALNANYFVFAQLYDPPKTEALAYLDGVTETPPDRYAIATVHRGRATPRDVMVRLFRTLLCKTRRE